MDETAVTQYFWDTFDGLDVVEGSGDSYFYYAPPSDGPADYRYPFATLVTGDRHDTVSNLSRESVFRLNVGVSKETFHALFGSISLRRGENRTDRIVDSGYDYSELDKIMPHPVYAAQYWLCALNPSEATFQMVRPLLDEAYAMAVKRHEKAARHPAVPENQQPAG